MAILKALNLTLRFFLELCLLGALGWVGFLLGGPMIGRIALAIVLPLVAAIIWGLFVAPRAAIAVPDWLWLAIQALLFSLAVAGLEITGHSQLAVVFGLAVIINIALLLIWRQRDTVKDTIREP
jgi:hypothetical protein